VTPATLRKRLQEVVREEMPLPARGFTTTRLRKLYAVGREDLSLAKLAEAHWDAIAILAEAGLPAEPDAIYAVWASEIPGQGMKLTERGDILILNGRKPFCSGLGIVDRALITVSDPRELLLDIDLRTQSDRMEIDLSQWSTTAFQATNTGAITFRDFFAPERSVVGPEKFYLTRPGFWNGACGPAACWLGGAEGLVAFANTSKRVDPHTLAHLGAMRTAVWAMEAAMDRTACEIDISDSDAMLRALRLRHIVEQGCTDILRRLPRAYGPYPIAMDAEVARRYQELDLFLRQTHGERDLEILGKSHGSDAG
jgi:alkylation response protein AidB-like acyl-CoA dehydrogenase